MAPLGMSHLLNGLLVATTLTALGCSGSGSKPRCEVALETLAGGCPATFDGTSSGLPACEGPVSYTARRCGDLISLDTFGGYFGNGCYYDATSHLLVGASAQSDVPSYCGDTSFAASAGRTTSCASEPLATKDCSSQP